MRRGAPPLLFFCAAGRLPFIPAVKKRRFAGQKNLIFPVSSRNNPPFFLFQFFKTAFLAKPSRRFPPRFCPQVNRVFLRQSRISPPSAAESFENSSSLPPRLRGVLLYLAAKPSHIKSLSPPKTLLPPVAAARPSPLLQKHKREALPLLFFIGSTVRRSRRS